MTVCRMTVPREAYSVLSEANVRGVHCFDDGAYIPIGEGTGFYTCMGKRYLCEECVRRLKDLSSYHANARRGYATQGTEKRGKIEQWSVGVELEGLTIEGINDIALLHELRELGMFESDCTVSWELPTSVQNGLNRLSKFLWYIEREGYTEVFNNSHCGAHIHCECVKVEYIRRYYHSIFLPLAQYIESLGSVKRLEYFGSDFRGYAHNIDVTSYAQEHSNIFNTQHIHTLEFRLPRYTGAKQYLTCIKFWRECVAYINNTDLHEEAQAQERKQEARKCGEALVKIAKKYYR